MWTLQEPSHGPLVNVLDARVLVIPHAFGAHLVAVVAVSMVEARLALLVVLSTIDEACLICAIFKA